MQTEINAIRTGTTTEVRLKASRDGDLRINQYLPPLAMLCADGKLFAFDMSQSTSKICVAAMPVKSPEWLIYNANPTGGKHIVLVHVGVISASGGMGLGLAVVAAVGIGEQTIASGNYENTVVSCLDGTAKTPNAFLVNDVAMINSTPAWSVFGATDQTAVDAIGTGVTARVDGKIIAPPKGVIGIEVVGKVGTSLYDVTIVIAEIQLDTA